jgi:hypothetical protein
MLTLPSGEMVEPSPPSWGIGMHSHLADIFVTICTCFDRALSPFIFVTTFPFWVVPALYFKWLLVLWTQKKLNHSRPYTDKYHPKIPLLSHLLDYTQKEPDHDYLWLVL